MSNQPEPGRDFERLVLAEVHSEVKALRAEVHILHQRIQHLHHQQHHTVYRHHWLGRFIHAFEYDPKVQYRVHLYASIFWIINAIIVTLALIFFNDQWQIIAVFYVAMVSLYANFATDYSGMSAALAAQGSAPLPEIPLETHVEAEELEDDPHASHDSR